MLVSICQYLQQLNTLTMMDFFYGIANILKISYYFRSEKTMNPYEKPPGRPEEPRVVICPNCGGSGKKSGEDCKRCEGTGKIRDK